MIERYGISEYPQVSPSFTNQQNEWQLNLQLSDSKDVEVLAKTINLKIQERQVQLMYQQRT